MAQSRELADWAEISPFVMAVDALHKGRGEMHLKPEERMKFRGYMIPQPPVINNNAHYRNYLAQLTPNYLYPPLQTVQNPLQGPFSLVKPAIQFTSTAHIAPSRHSIQYPAHHEPTNMTVHDYPVLSSSSQHNYSQSQDPFNLHPKGNHDSYIEAFVEDEEVPVKGFQGKLGPLYKRRRINEDQISPTPKPRSSRKKRKQADDSDDESDEDYTEGRVRRNTKLPEP